jgi:hypothetical protein
MRSFVQIDPYLFDEAELIDALQEEEGEDLADTVDVELPDKFMPDKWVQWEIKFTNYLGTKSGVRGLFSFILAIGSTNTSSNVTDAICISSNGL